MSDDAELLARLKAAADEAWAASYLLAQMADLGLVAPSSFYAALEKAREASRVYQAVTPIGRGE
jgi:hypothetical protein